MLKFFNQYFKYKAASLIKDKILFYEKENQKCKEKLSYYENLVYTNKCVTKEQFEKSRLSSIKYFNEQWVINLHRIRAIYEILSIIEKL